MNPVNAFVHHQFEKPNLLLAFAFFVSPYIIYFVPAVLLGRQLIPQSVGITIGKGIAVGAIATVLLYLLLYAFKGKEVRGKIVSLASSFSLNYMLLTLASVLSILVFIFTFSNFYSQLYEGKDTITTMSQVQSLMLSTQPSELVILFASIALFVLVISLFLSSFHLIYSIGNKVRKTSMFSNTAFTIIYFAVLFSIIVILQL